VPGVAPSTSRIPLFLSALVLLLPSACTRAYLQREGRYAFTADEIIRDDCGLLSSKDALWDGSLAISGDVVRVDSDWRHFRLIGAFLQDSSGSSDTFSVDGTESNAAITLEAGECIADQIAMHLEGTTQRATTFSGVISVRVEPRVQQPWCSCQLWVKYSATQIAPSAASFP
jgi:hypothetical protein